MKPITCIAIDDEPMALLVIERFCQRKGDMILSTYSEPRLGLEAIRSQKPDIVFLDIQMNSITGLEIADLLPKECCFIFTTAYAEYALEGFNLDAVDYLLKPFAYERFVIAVEKALRRIEGKVKDAPRVIVVKQEYNNVTVELDKIIYIEALGNYCKIHCMNKKHILTRTNLKNLLTMLPDSQFIRINRSFIISLDKVERFTKKQVVLRNVAQAIPVGDSYVSYINNSFLSNIIKSP